MEEDLLVVGAVWESVILFSRNYIYKKLEMITEKAIAINAEESKEIINEIYKGIILNERFLPVNIGETDAAFLIQLSLPGYKKEWLKIEIEETYLVITLRHAGDQLSKMWRYYKKEIDTGFKKIKLPFPAGTYLNNITVTYTAGLLSLVVPKLIGAVSHPGIEIPIL